MKTQRAFVLGLVLLQGGLSGLAAQEPRTAAGRARVAGAEAAENARVAVALANALDHYAVVQAQRFLQLNDAENAQLVPLLRALQQVRRRNNQARHRILQDLRRMAGPRAEGEPDEAVLRERLSALREHDERSAQEIRAAYATLDEVMTPRQQARFRLFEENIEARKLELLMRAKARAGRSGS
jgi:hypothetical protein